MTTKRKSTSTTSKVQSTDPMKGPPPDASPAARAFYARVEAEYGLDDPDARMTMYMLCRHFDRAEEAAALVREQGQLIPGPRAGAMRANPCISVERDARSNLLKCLAHLGLASTEEALAPKAKIGRPPRGG